MNKKEEDSNDFMNYIAKNVLKKILIVPNEE